MSDIYDLWNTKKKQLQTSQVRTFYPKPQEIWNVEIGQNIGNEQTGGVEYRRPFLLLKKVGNLFFGLPLTSKSKIDFWHFPIISSSIFDEKDRVASSKICIGQAKLLDPKRFIKQIGWIDKKSFENIKKIVTDVYL